MSVTTTNGHGTLEVDHQRGRGKMIDVARTEGIETVWDRLAAQEPQCGYCVSGLSCRNCAMGPCRIDPFGEGPQKGVCGADADVIVARNLGRKSPLDPRHIRIMGETSSRSSGPPPEGETTGDRIADEANSCVWPPNSE